jgi:hypothetical protein
VLDAELVREFLEGAARERRTVVGSDLARRAETAGQLFEHP